MDNIDKVEIVLHESDLTEQFTHSSGKGGQNVNKVATCVFLRHIPTGIEVKCQKYRSQMKNRVEARRILLAKLINLKTKEIAKKLSDLEKEKRKNRPKPKALKENILKEKKIQSRKKILRSKSNISLSNDE